MEGILTAAGQLAHASEFRFDVWRTREGEHRFIVVRRGTSHHEDRWAVHDGHAFWDGEAWNDELRGPSVYRYELDEALLTAKRLAYEQNQHWVSVFEAKYPGEVRGSHLDMSTRKEGEVSD